MKFLTATLPGNRRTKIGKFIRPIFAYVGVFWMLTIPWIFHPISFYRRGSRFCSVSDKCFCLVCKKCLCSRVKISVRGLSRHFLDTQAGRPGETFWRLFGGFLGSGFWRLLHMGIVPWLMGNESVTKLIPKRPSFVTVMANDFHQNYEL